MHEHALCCIRSNQCSPLIAHYFAVIQWTTPRLLLAQHSSRSRLQLWLSCEAWWPCCGSRIRHASHFLSLKPTAQAQCCGVNINRAFTPRRLGLSIVVLARSICTLKQSITTMECRVSMHRTYKHQVHMRATWLNRCRGSPSPASAMHIKISNCDQHIYTAIMYTARRRQTRRKQFSSLGKKKLRDPPANGNRVNYKEKPIDNKNSYPAKVGLVYWVTMRRTV